MSRKSVIVDDHLSWAQSTSGIAIETTVREVILQNVNRHSDKIAIISDHEGICKTFKQLFDDSCNMAENLVTVCGLSLGDHVAIATGNCYNYLVSYLACAIKGLVICTYDPNLTTEEVDRYVKTVKPSAFFTAGLGSAQLEIFPNMAAIRDKMQTMGVPIVFVDGVSGDIQNSYHIDDLLVASQNGEVHGQLTKKEDAFVVLATSGSTGQPKLISWSYGAGLATEQFWYASLDFKDGDKVCLPLSTHHAFASTMIRSILFASHQIILTGYKYSLAQTVSCLTKYDCNYVTLVPTMLHDFLDCVTKSKPKLSLEGVVLSSAALREDMARRMSAILPNIVYIQFYAMSETDCSGIVTKNRFDTVGQPLGDCKVKIVDENGNILPHGNTGRLLVNAKYHMTGYLKPDGAMDDSVFDSEGYLDTGDLASMNNEGYLCYQGRGKDNITRGGVQISPKEVENVILSVAGVIDCLVLGIPDKLLGEEVVAVVQVDGASSLQAENIVSSITGKISQKKMPKYIHISTKLLPRLSNQKYDKQALRQQMSKIYNEVTN